MQQHIKLVSPREAYAAYFRDGLLVDVRKPEEVAAKSIAVQKTIFLPYDELGLRFTELPQNKPVYIVSRIGNKGMDAARFLAEHGYEDVATVDGGLLAWEEEGLPVKSC